MGELTLVKVQEWMYAVFEWLGVTDPLAMSVGVGVIAGGLIVVGVGAALRLAVSLAAQAVASVLVFLLWVLSFFSR